METESSGSCILYLLNSWTKQVTVKFLNVLYDSKHRLIADFGVSENVFFCRRKPTRSDLLDSLLAYCLPN